MRVSPVSLLGCIFSCVFKCVLSINTRASREELYTYMCASLVSLLACIFSRMLSLAFEQHVNFQKSITEMNVSLMHASVKFRLSCTVCCQNVIWQLVCTSKLMFYYAIYYGLK